MINQEFSETIKGINVFGSATLRIEPDLASLVFGVKRLTPHPRDSFQQVREGAASVRAFLTQAGITDVRLSRVTLAETTRFEGGQMRFLGYTATVSFYVLLHDLDRMEEILTGIVEAGSDEINSVELETSRLKELRSEARRNAVEAAHEKALNYCLAAGVELGPLLYLEDVNPDDLPRPSQTHRTYATMLGAGSVLTNTFEPGSIAVKGAVRVGYEIKH